VQRPFLIRKRFLHLFNGAIAGILLSIKRRTLRLMAFPITLLASAVAVHLVHRHWWDYYYLHLAIPLAWLAAYAIYEAIRWSSNILQRRVPSLLPVRHGEDFLFARLQR
jgi:hypothetical protein